MLKKGFLFYKMITLSFSLDESWSVIGESPMTHRIKISECSNDYIYNRFSFEYLQLWVIFYDSYQDEFLLWMRRPFLEKVLKWWRAEIVFVIFETELVCKSPLLISKNEGMSHRVWLIEYESSSITLWIWLLWIWIVLFFEYLLSMIQCRIVWFGHMTCKCHFRLEIENSIPSKSGRIDLTVLHWLYYTVVWYYHPARVGSLNWGVENCKFCPIRVVFALIGTFHSCSIPVSIPSNITFPVLEKD